MSRCFRAVWVGRLVLSLDEHSVSRALFGRRYCLRLPTPDLHDGESRGAFRKTVRGTANERSAFKVYYTMGSHAQ